MYSTAVILMVVSCLTQNVASFVVPFPSAAAARHGVVHPISHCSFFPTSRLPQPLYMSNVNSEDPFVILNLNPPTADVREIKRAYKRAALKYHPDVVCNSSSTKEERRQANDHFAKINWAYEQLSGKQSTTSTSTSTTQPPPHRRKAASTSYSTNTWTDWRDYIPNYNNNKEEEQYDAGGDSFGAILSDLLGAAASTAAGSGGIFRDFVEFLEQNVDGYATTNNDNDLDTLLKYASKQQVAMEMDDTELVVTSLESKQRNVNDELLTKTADLQFAQRFSERIELEERIAELQARKRVVDGYLKTARKRLLSLQSRYKELVVGGRVADSPPPRGEYTRSSYEPFTKGGTSSSSSYSSSSNSSSTGASSRRPSTTTTSSSTSETENAWKTQGFGSSGRGRGSSSRRRRSRPSSGTERTREEPAMDRTSSSTWNTDESSPRQERATPPPPRTNTPARTTVSSTDDWKAPVPPHRRTKSETSQAQKDRKRLRELQVEDEFAKLKKELGL